MTTPYAIIHPPSAKPFHEMSRQELKKYFQWFFEVLPLRIAGLASVVRQSPGFETWDPDRKPDSLNALGEWFRINAATRPLTPEEVDDINKNLSFPIEFPKQELTNVTFSLAVDIGMYLSQVFLQECPFLRWEQPLDDKKFAYYGQPVLVGFGAIPLNPVHIAVTLAYGLVDGSRGGERLRELYDYWSKMARAKS